MTTCPRPGAGPRPWFVRSGPDALDARSGDLTRRLRHAWQILDGYCRDRPYCWIGNAEWAAAYGCTPRNAQVVLKDMEEAGLIRRILGDGSGKTRRFGIAMLRRVDPRLPAADSEAGLAAAAEAMEARRQPLLPPPSRALKSAPSRALKSAPSRALKSAPGIKTQEVFEKDPLENDSTRARPDPAETPGGPGSGRVDFAPLPEEGTGTGAPAGSSSPPSAGEIADAIAEREGDLVKFHRNHPTHRAALASLARIARGDYSDLRPAPPRIVPGVPASPALHAGPALKGFDRDGAPKPRRGRIARDEGRPLSGVMARVRGLDDPGWSLSRVDALAEELGRRWRDWPNPRLLGQVRDAALNLGSDLLAAKIREADAAKIDQPARHFSASICAALRAHRARRKSRAPAEFGRPSATA